MPTPHIDCPRAKSDMTPCVLRDGELAADDRGCCVGCGERIDKSAPQTGGGDAGERARAIADASIDARVCCDKYPACQTEAWRVALAKDIETALRSSHREGAEEARQDALRVPFTKALVAEARTQGYREGAETIRDAIAVIRGKAPEYDKLIARLEGLIPGKTDAG